MSKKVKLGYQVGPAKEIFISPSHLIVTGITQQSGKTTTLEALILRSEFKAIVFKTKIGERSFSSGNVIPPFFRDRSDYEFVRSLIEAYAREKIFLEKGALMNVCKGSKNLIEIKMRVDEQMATGKLRGIKEEIYTRLQHYLENLIPQIQYASFSSTLNASEGINIMDLERFSEEAQALIIRSVADEVLKNHSNTIIVIPEAWKFLPQKYNNPCKEGVVKLIKQGAANNNFVWIDSQAMADVDKSPLKQISTWILGYQSERNEVKHTLDQISLPKASKPKEDDIMNLQVGHFILSSRDQVVKVYVQPSWMNDEDAKAVAAGEKEVGDVMSAQPLPSFNFKVPPAMTAKQDPNTTAGYASRKDLQQLRIDFFNKLKELTDDVNNFLKNLSHHAFQPAAAIDEEHIVSLVLQKMPPQKITAPATVNVDVLINEVLKRIPAGSGASVYHVAPLEKIRKDFLQEIRTKIASEVQELSADEKIALKYIESRDKDVTPNELVVGCFFLKPGGTASSKISRILAALKRISVVEVTAGSRYRKGLLSRIKFLMNSHAASDAEIETTYNHILNDLL